MIKEYDTILKDVLEAKDTGISLSSLLDAHPLQKGEYSDAWKFIEGINDYSKKDIYPSKDSFKLLIDTIPSPKPILSRWMPFIGITTPALIIVLMIFSYSRDNTTEKPTIESITTTEESSSALFDMSAPSTLEGEASPNETSAPRMAKMAASPNFEDSMMSLQNAYEQDSQAQTQSTIAFEESRNYENLSTLYE